MLTPRRVIGSSMEKMFKYRIRSAQRLVEREEVLSDVSDAAPGCSAGNPEWSR